MNTKQKEALAVIVISTTSVFSIFGIGLLLKNWQGEWALWTWLGLFIVILFALLFNMLADDDE